MNYKTMSKLKERDEQEALKLDEHFKRTLACVRPYIVGLTSAEDVQLCKVWLDKLNSTTQRILRNEYLVELYRQLETGHIGGVFSKPPPNGPLVPLPRSYHMVCMSSSLSELSECTVTRYQGCSRSNAKCIRHDRSKTPSRYREADSTNQCSHAIRISPTIHFYDENHKNQLEAFRQQIDMLNIIIKELKIQNENLKRDLLECRKIRGINGKSELYIKHLTGEIGTLKNKLTEVQKLKEILEASHQETVKQYRNTVAEQISKLKLQLREIQCRTETLDSNVVTMSRKIKEITNMKEEEIKIIENQWMNKLKELHDQYEMLLMEKEKALEQKELELSENELKRKEEITSLTNKIQDLENKLEIKIEDEAKLQATLVNQYTTIKEEFSKMRSEMDLGTQSQSLASKVLSLKKTIVKLEKSRKNLVHDYERKIYHMLKDKDLEIKTLQLQLQGQKGELCMTLSSKKQCELDSLVDVLEKRYKALLAVANTTAESQHQEYIKKITLLEGQLSRLKHCCENDAMQR